MQKLTSLSALLLATALVVVVSACATSGDAVNGAVPAGDAGKDASKTDGGVNNADGSGGGGTCTSQCQTDTDCQSSCGPLSSGIYCCDTLTATCFTVADSVCPSVPDADTGG